MPDPSKNPTSLQICVNIIIPPTTIPFVIIISVFIYITYSLSKQKICLDRRAYYCKQPPIKKINNIFLQKKKLNLQIYTSNYSRPSYIITNKTLTKNNTRNNRVMVKFFPTPSQQDNHFIQKNI